MVANGNGPEKTVLSRPIEPTSTKPALSSNKAALKPQPSGPNKVYEQPGQQFGDWRDDLVRDGYVIVKGAVPREKAEQYGDRMLSYLENL
jgi:hypothetical protein